MSDFTDELDTELAAPTPIFLGVLGTREDAKLQEISDKVMNKVIHDLGRLPERMILPSEGASSIFIGDWAERMKIPTEVQDCDWFRHQKRAKIFRDARIEKEATHFILFLNKRSTFQEKKAEKMRAKGIPVQTVNYQTWEITVPSRIQSSEHTPSTAKGSKKSRKPSSQVPEPPKGGLRQSTLLLSAKS